MLRDRAVPNTGTQAYKRVRHAAKNQDSVPRSEGALCRRKRKKEEKKRGMIPFRATDGDKSHRKHAVQSAVLKRSDLRGEQW